MGIRFQCPNGHNLHVKSFLAGKRAICPECGIKVLIPNHLEDKVPEEPADPVVHIATNGSQNSLANSEPTATVPQTTATAHTTGVPPPIGPTSHQDSITASPEAVWYVRSPAGDQYGPAPGEVFQKWLEEGRVTADCLVWREDWEEWRSASDLVQSIGKTAVPLPPTAGETVNGLQIDTVGRSMPRAKQRKRTLKLVILLLVLCIVLLFPLAYLVIVGM